MPKSSSAAAAAATTNAVSSRTTYVIAGIPVHVYAERHLTRQGGPPVAVMFFLHGRTGTAKGIEWVVEDTLRQVAQKRRECGLGMELVVVTFVRSFLFACVGCRD